MPQLIQSLQGPAGDFVRGADPMSFYTRIDHKKGIVKASIIANSLEHSIKQGMLEKAEKLYERGLIYDPLAGWQQPFRKSIDALLWLQRQFT